MQAAAERGTAGGASAYACSASASCHRCMSRRSWTSEQDCLRRRLCRRPWVDEVCSTHWQPACDAMHVEGAGYVQAAALRATTARRVLGDQLRQAQEKRARDAALCRLYTNPVRPEYFAQFETSHR